MDFDMNNLLQQAQQMQEKMKKAQEEAANAEVTGEAGAGLVKVVMNGRHDVKNVSLETTELENTIFEWCHKDALLNGAHFIIERIVAKPERQDLHVIVAQWMLNVPGMCLRTQLCKLAALLINESPHLPEVYALVQGFMTPFPKGIMVTTCSWNERSGKMTYFEELDPYCHDFIRGRLLRDDRLCELAAAIYHYDEHTKSYFEQVGHNFPDLQETLDKVRSFKMTCTFSSL